MEQPPNPNQQYPQQQWQQPQMPPQKWNPQQQWNPQQPPFPPQQYQQPPYPQQPPYQYPPQVPPPKKRGIGKFFAIGCGSLVALVILVIVLAAVVSGGHTSSSSNSFSPTGTTTSDSQSSSGNTVAKVGQTITVDSVATTLISVHKLSVGPDDIQPKSGNEYIVVRVKIVNTGSSEVTYNEFDFHAESGSGNVTDSTVLPPASYTANNVLNSGNLAAGGGSVTGDILFEVPTGDHQAKLTWQPSIFGNSTTYSWDLGL